MRIRRRREVTRCSVAFTVAVTESQHGARRPWQRQPQRRPRQRSLHETTRSGPWSARSRESACTQHSAIGSARRGCSRSPCARTCSSAHSAASLCGDGDDDGGHLRRERCRFRLEHGASAAETRGDHGVRAGRCRPELQRRGNSDGQLAPTPARRLSLLAASSSVTADLYEGDGGVKLRTMAQARRKAKHCLPRP